MSGQAGLRRFVRTGAVPIDTSARPVATGETCEFCGESLGAEHPHVASVAERSLKCACRPCYLLFTPDGARSGRYVAVPERYLDDPEAPLTEGEWDALEVPVAMAFFFHNSALGAVVGQYPSPAGATESLLNLEAWDDIVAAHPLAAELQPDVEALFVHRSRTGIETWLVPIDVCYELVGRVRMHWKGFDGGQEARADIDAFLDRVRSNSRHLLGATRA